MIESKPPALEGKVLTTGHNCISVKVEKKKEEDTEPRKVGDRTEE